MLTVKFSKEGQAISDYEVSKFLLNALKRSLEEDVELHLGTLMCLAYLQLLVAEGCVEPENLKIIYFDEEICLNQDGAILNEPADLWSAYKIHLKLINQFMAKTKDNEIL